MFAYGPSWAPLPQTSQAGEFGALEASPQCIVGPFRGHSDCLNAVKAKGAPRTTQLSYERPSAGLMFSALAAPWAEFKVKTRILERGARASQDVLFEFGNDSSDAAAKLGPRLHPQPDTSKRETLDWQIRVAQSIVHLGARLLPAWPRLGRTGVDLVKCPKGR